ncbi:MAG: magnesium/cobalt transporter CorA [Thermoplasmatota archaeon]
MVNISRYLKKRNQRIGLPPGSLVHVGKKVTNNIDITLFNFNEHQFEEKDCSQIEECFHDTKSDFISWININGIHEIKPIESLGKQFGLHPLTLEDIMNSGQRPKIESFDSYVYLVLKMLSIDEKTKQLSSEQISIILGQNIVISLQEKPGDVFDPVRQRMRQGKGRIRKMGADYLTYCLVDAIVDHYFVIMESIGERIEEMEDDVVDHPRPETLQSIYRLKADVIFLRKSIWPLRELINGLIRDDSNFVSDEMTVFLRDVYDHTIQVMDAVETYRDMIAGLLDIYMSSVSNKLNEVMKVLTIFASIFIPLTFIAGIYGMNFNPAISPFNMPELNWFWGYPFALLIMMSMAVTMIIYFKRKKWL